LKKYVTSDEDVNLVVRSIRVSPGITEITLMIEEPIYLQIYFTPFISQSHVSCGGSEINLTTSKLFKDCQSDGTASTNECSAAFKKGTFWEPTEDPAFMKVNFAESIQPTRVVYKPKGDQKPNIITL